MKCKLTYTKLQVYSDKDGAILAKGQIDTEINGTEKRSEIEPYNI